LLSVRPARQFHSMASARVGKDDVDMAQFTLPSHAAGTKTSRNTRVPGKPNFGGYVIGTTRMVIVAIDYNAKNNSNTGNANYGPRQKPLTCTIDAKNVEVLAQQCGCEVTSLYNEQCTKRNVLAAIDRVGQSCKQDDVFVFYFAGRGAQIKDVSGDEDDGLDEAFVLLNANGQVANDSLMIDDDFSDTVYNACHDPKTRILILTDCGLDVADLSGKKWAGRKAISISAFSDVETENANVTNGIFTHSMLLGIDKIGQLGRYHTRDKTGHLGLDDYYSVGMLYNATLLEDAAVFANKQELTIQCTADASAERMPWPLMPPYGYEAPLRSEALGHPKYESDDPFSPDKEVARDCTGQALFKGCSPCRAPPI